MDFSIKPPGSSGQRMRRQSTNTNRFQGAPPQTFQAQMRLNRSPGPQQPGYGYPGAYGNGNGYGHPGGGVGYGQGAGEGYPAYNSSNLTGFSNQGKQGWDDGASVASARAPSIGRRAPSMTKLGARLTETVASVLMSGALLIAPKPSKIALGMQPSNAALGQTRLLILAFPRTTTDIAQLYEAVFLHSLPFNNQPPLYDDDIKEEDDYEEDLSYVDAADDDSDYDEYGQKIKRGDRRKPRRSFRNGIVPDILDSRVCMAFGHITKAAVEKTPVLIIIDSARPDTPHFINVNTIDHFISEVDLGIPGTLAFRLGKHEHRFAASSSREYQRWEAAFFKAMDIVAEMKKSIAVSKKHMSETPSSSISVFSSIGGGSSTKTDSLDFRNAAGPRNSSSSTVSGMGGPLGGKLSVKDLTSKMLAFRGFSVSSKRNSDQTIESSSSTVGARTLSPTLSSNRSASPIPPSATVSYKVESQSAAPNSQTSSTTSQPQEQQQQQQNRQATAYQGAFQQGYQQEYYPQYQYQSTFAEPPGPSSTSAFMSTTSTTSTTATTKELPLPTAASTLPLAREIMEIYDHRSSTASSAGSFAVPQSVTTAGAPSIPFVAPIPVQPQTDSLASVLPYKSKEAPFNRFKYSAYSAFVSEAVARGHVGL